MITSDFLVGSTFNRDAGKPVVMILTKENALYLTKPDAERLIEQLTVVVNDMLFVPVSHDDARIHA